MKLPLAATRSTASSPTTKTRPGYATSYMLGSTSLAERLEVSRRKVDGPIRVRGDGTDRSGLPLFDVAEYLGRDETLARLRAGRARLG